MLGKRAASAVVVAAVVAACALALVPAASAFVYWANSQNDAIGRSNNDGSGVAHIYWANQNGNSIGRANTDGTGVDQSFIATGGNQPCGVAVDSGYSPPPGPEPPEPAAGDATPPRTKIASGPGKALVRGIAKFRFRSSEAGSTFLCKLDKRKVARCKSSKTYRHLKHGRHRFKVWAIDAAGNKDPTPAKRKFRVPAG